jgi:hypothetical protein
MLVRIEMGHAHASLGKSLHLGSHFAFYLMQANPSKYGIANELRPRAPKASSRCERWQFGRRR